MDLSWITLRRLAQSLPIVFALHVAEECFGFVPWFNARVDPDITWGSFVTVTSVGFGVTVIIAAQLAVSRGRAIGLLASAWVGFVMFANGLFHVAAAILDGGYVPGAGTAVLLYLPVSLLLFGAVWAECAIRPTAIAAAALLGGIPMYWHCWLILFRGSRLF
jgi:hypothetical protein